MTKKPIAFDGKNSELLLYQTEDGATRIDVRLVNETVWLTQAQMADLFQRDRSVITKHIRNIFDEGELKEPSVCANFAHTGTDKKTYQVQYYNLDVIISVGYRVNSHRGTQFRQWATQRLREYIIKGFALDDTRLSSGRTTDSYFDELISRVRAIRTSEYNLYRKVREIYATSFDYDSHSDITREFYATVQNKMHWAVHGNTAAEIIKKRADAKKPNMGLTAFKGQSVHAADAIKAKNYLTEGELKQLELLVDQYLSFAELQAMNRRPMHMKDWKGKLDAFLKFNDREILGNAGRISKQVADDHALAEYHKYRTRQVDAANANDLKTLDKQIKEIPGHKRKRPS
ncbi:MAG: virulence RhuM family protein [Alphaproteobacteria bacterium]|nr:virulence RhuM family protein [Alphaproteobacteria bacterium]